MSISPFGIVRTRFVTTYNHVGFACKNVQTILFIERGFERLGPDHRTVVGHGIHIELNRVRSKSLSPGGGLGGFLFLVIFLSPFFRIACSSFYISLYSFSFVHV